MIIIGSVYMPNCQVAIHTLGAPPNPIKSFSNQAFFPRLQSVSHEHLTFLCACLSCFYNTDLNTTSANLFLYLILGC